MQSTSSYRKILGLPVLTIGVLLLSGCATTGNRAGAEGGLEGLEPITLRFSSQETPVAATAAATLAFQEYVTEHTDGLITWENYFSASLVPGPEFLEALSSGILDVARIPTSFVPTELRIANWLVFTGGEPERMWPMDLVQGMLASNQLYLTSEDVAEEYSAHGARLLMTQSTGYYPMICSKPVQTLADAEGVRNRVGGGAWNAEAEALGMTPSVVPVLETYEALQRGIVDCVTIGESGIETYGLWEVGKYVSTTQFSTYPGGFHLAINDEIWSGFPDDVKRVFAAASGLYSEAYVDILIGEHLKILELGVSEHGLEYLDTPELNDVLAEHQRATFASLSDRAPDSVTDPEGMLEEYRAYLDAWAEKWKDGGLPTETEGYEGDLKRAPGLDYGFLFDDMRDSDWYVASFLR
ncbi:hypothetical protein [Microbacterium album]|nr:hypothetical protein [Microbacterium album]